jgi:hypothetical protein
MGCLSFARYFRLHSGAIECDVDGLRVGSAALLARDAKGSWTRRDGGELNHELSKLYGLPLDCERKSGALDAVAAALTNGELARAQIGALLLQLPDPPASADAQPDGLEKRRLARDLVACGLLKADADWDDKHPRTGAPPNPGWFALTEGATTANTPRTKPSPTTGAPPGDARLAFAPAAPTVSASPLLAEDLSVTALRALAALAARLSAAAILFDAIFVPSDNHLVEEGRIPGRPDIAYRWAHDESERAVTLKVLIDGQWRTLAVGGAAPNGLIYARDGRVAARVINGPDRRQTLVTTVSALDRAIADLRREDGEPIAAPVANDNEPKLCPDPMEEPKTMTSARANAIAYQEYVSGLRYPLAIFFGGVWFDGCDEPTGNLLDAKAKNDHIFDLDADNALQSWVYPEKNPAIQMRRQLEVALAAGRKIVRHAQTVKTYQGLETIADRLPPLYRPVVTVVYDPN